VGSVSLTSCLTLERVTRVFWAHVSRQNHIPFIYLTLLRAHVTLSLWEGRNALDAAVLGYNNISALRQQFPQQFVFRYSTALLV